MSAAWTRMPSNSPSVSTAMCRLRPFRRFAASQPRGPPLSVVLTLWVSMMAAVGLASRPAPWRNMTTKRWRMLSHTPRHSAYRSQFVVVAYPWHPLHGQRVRVYGRQGRAGRQILYIEVQPGLSRELPAWMCDGAACASITSGSAQIAVAGLIELRAILDSRSV